MTRSVQVALVAIGLSYYCLSVALAVRRHFVGTGPSPGSIGASIPLLIVLFAHSAWPLWLRLILAPVVAAFEFSWVAAYWLLQRFFPRPR